MSAQVRIADNVVPKAKALSSTSATEIYENVALGPTQLVGIDIDVEHITYVDIKLEWYDALDMSGAGSAAWYTLLTMPIINYFPFDGRGRLLNAGDKIRATASVANKATLHVLTWQSFGGGQG